jgi:GNAT superfamily N-acetyltransferase
VLDALVARAYRGEAARAGWTHEADLLGGQRADPAMIAAIIADRASRTLVAAVAGETVGCFTVRDEGSGLAAFAMLAVDPARQRRGIGRALFDAAIARARADFGATRGEMTVIRQRGDLIAWYARLGWRLTGESRPFPYGDARFGAPRRDDLGFVVMARRFG